jgi:hypothetical protein
MNQWLAYFARPFPRAEGFSAYRSPGLMVHAPVFAAFCFLGLRLLQGTPAFLLPLGVVYLAIGLYGGRDVAIFCHYAPVLTLLCFAMALGALVGLKSILAVFDALQAKSGAGYPYVAVALTVALGVLFWRYVAWRIRDAERS